MQGHVTHRLNAERVGYPVEEGEHGGNIDGLRELLVGPSGGPQRVGVIASNFVCLEGNLASKREQQPFSRGQPGGVQVSRRDGGYGLVIGSLFTQEVGMGVQSIRAAIQG